MIDCNITENYLAEKARMTKRQKCNYCGIKCYDCPLSDRNNGVSGSLSCMGFELLHPKKAIAIVQKWSNEHPEEHPQKTFLSELLKNYPNTILEADGTPEGICPYNLGLMSIEDCDDNRAENCIECWNQSVEVEGVDEEK